MTQTQKDIGFFAMVPRIVRLQYIDLSHAEKWLYTCLKDLCGDKGACFRTLQTLHEETGISVSSLKTMIPNLKKSGIIQAEKRARGIGGKDLWHITMVDLWEENSKQYPCTNSQNLSIDESNSQKSSLVTDNSQNLAIASGMNSQNLSDDLSTNSQNLSEQWTNFGYRRILIEEESIEEESVKEKDSVVSLREHDTPLTFFVPDAVQSANGRHVPIADTELHPPLLEQMAIGETTPAPKPRSRKKSLDEIAPLAPPECPPESAPWNATTCTKLADYYRTYTKLSERKSKRARDAVISLIQRGKTREQVTKTYRYLLCLDKQEDGTGIFDEWWEGKEVDIWNVAEHIDVKLREIERKMKVQQNGHSSNGHVPYVQRGTKPASLLPPVPTEDELRMMPY